MIVWLVGLSGSGKTTLGNALFQQWREIESNTVMLDGDIIRKIFSHDKPTDSYDIAARRVNAERIVSLCELLDKQNINVVCCILSIFPEMRAENRERFRSYYEIFMDASLETVMQRDVKGIYAAASRGEMKNVVGIDIHFEKPATADLIINSSSNTTDIQALAKEILVNIGVA
jgi:adenylylsulfate kinase-like enzyme